MVVKSGGFKALVLSVFVLSLSACNSSKTASDDQTNNSSASLDDVASFQGLSFMASNAFCDDSNDQVVESVGENIMMDVRSDGRMHFRSRSIASAFGASGICYIVYSAEISNSSSGEFSLKNYQYDLEGECNEDDEDYVEFQRDIAEVITQLVYIFEFDGEILRLSLRDDTTGNSCVAYVVDSDS